MENETTEAKLMGFLTLSERLTESIIRRMINTTGRQRRTYTDTEELYMERLESALGHIRAARFSISQSTFRLDHEEGAIDAGKKRRRQ